MRHRPQAGQQKPTIGTIIAINETTKEDFDVDVGTRLLFGKFSGQEVEIDGEKLMILEMDEAFAILRENTE